MKLLIVDDDPVIGVLIAQIFQDEFTEIRRVGAFDELKLALEQSTFNLVFLDYFLNDCNGLDVLKYIRARFSYIDLPVIMLTENNQMCIEALALEANDYVKKPFAIEELVARTRNYMLLYKYKNSAQAKNQELESSLMQTNKTLCINIDKLKLAEKEMCLRLGRAAEFRDIETGEHIKRMSDVSTRLGQLLKLDVVQLELLHAASRVHDLGKVGIPDAILKKSAKLTQEEFEVMKTHTVIGARLLEGADEFALLSTARVIALEHHEKFDGSGYPHAKVGQEIDLLARIVALADVYDALRSKRVYKEAMGAQESKEIIVKERGKHFDPQIVDVFIENISEFEAYYGDEHQEYEAVLA